MSAGDLRGRDSRWGKDCGLCLAEPLGTSALAGLCARTPGPSTWPNNAPPCQVPTMSRHPIKHLTFITQNLLRKKRSSLFSKRVNRIRDVRRITSVHAKGQKQM